MSGIFHRVGENVVAKARGADEVFAFTGEAFSAAIWSIFHPHRFRFRDFARAFERTCCDGLPIASGIGFLLGLILAFESAAALRMFGAEVYVADMLGIALFRELGPIITAIVLAGRSGSAFAAEIGTMKVDEELDALTTMGLDPVRFLVMPRVLAATLAMPVLTIFSELAGLVGGAIVLRMMDVPPVVYWQHVMSMSGAMTIAAGLAKGALFGFLVALIGCGAGMGTKSTADGVGVAATKAVVGGMLAIAISDGVLAVVAYAWGV
ncbi:MAG: ABC transporter permease [Kiritimatiellae bacterium]|nr:ABC transporter permease [Kiritimatiellia bacterium]